MVDINLLPERDEIRARQRKLWQRIGVIFICCFLFIGLPLHFFFNYQKDARNTMLHQVILKKYQAKKTLRQLKKIKFIAYLHQGTRTSAMLLLPSGQVQDVQVGSDLDVDEAKVVGITREKVILVLPNNRVFSVLAQSNG